MYSDIVSGDDFHAMLVQVNCASKPRLFFAQRVAGSCGHIDIDTCCGYTVSKFRYKTCNAIIGNKGGMRYEVHAGIHSLFNAGCSVGVNGYHFAESVGFVDACSQFLEGELRSPLG